MLIQQHIFIMAIVSFHLCVLQQQQSVYFFHSHFLFSANAMSISIYSHPVLWFDSHFQLIATHRENINAFDFLFTISLIKVRKTNNNNQNLCNAIVNCYMPVYHICVYVNVCNERDFYLFIIFHFFLSFYFFKYIFRCAFILMNSEKWAFNMYIEKQEMDANIFLFEKCLC